MYSIDSKIGDANEPWPPVGPIEKLFEESFELLREVKMKLMRQKPEVAPLTGLQQMDDLAEKYTKEKDSLLKLHPRERRLEARNKIRRLFAECYVRYKMVSAAKRNVDFFSFEPNRKEHMPKSYTHEDYVHDLEANKLFAEAAVCELRTAFEERLEAVQAHAVLAKVPLSAEQVFQFNTKADENMATMQYISELAHIGVDAFNTQIQTNNFAR